MELLISEIVARVFCKCANLYRDVNDAVQKAYILLFYEVIFDKKRNTVLTPKRPRLS